MNTCRTILVCLLVLLMLSACTAPTRQAEDLVVQTTGDVTAETITISTAASVKTETVEVDGVVYRNNFQSNLIFMDPQYESDPVLEKGLDRYFRLYCDQYELLYNVNVRDIGVGESVYCRDDQWQQLHDYYANTDNFTYECYSDEYGAAEPVFYSVPDMDIVKLNALVAFCELNSYDPFGTSNGLKTRQVPYAVSRETELRFGKTSKDMLFSEGTGDFFIWEGKLLLEWYTYSDDYMLVADVPDELSQYFIALVNNIDKSQLSPNPANESAANTRDWKKLLNTENHPLPFRDRASLFAEVEKMKKKARETESGPDDRIFCIPSILKTSQSSLVSVQQEYERTHKLEYFSQESIKSSVTQLCYAPFVVSVQIMSETEMQAMEGGVDMSPAQKYRYDDAVIYLKTEKQGDGLMMFGIIWYRQNNPIGLIAGGYIYPPHESIDILAEKLFQDFQYVSLAN